MEQKYFYSIVIGSGIAGLYAALRLSKSCREQKVLVVTKSEILSSNSYYAQGGMVSVLKSNEIDSVDLHVHDTLVAGAGLNDNSAVRFISENSDSVVKDLLNFGVNFDRDKNGEYTLTKEAAHSVNRILHSGGDATGRQMEIALCNCVKSNENIIVYENTQVIDLIKNTNNECCGIRVINADDEIEEIYSNSTILATGGLGQIYKYTTNPNGATGDGYALAYRAGAKLRDMEFVQFHPTALAIDETEANNRFLISEAVRGEGAKLCDRFGNYYMREYDIREDLAPRDIVARANFTQMQKNNTTNVYLDASIIEREKLLKRFPTIYNKCIQHGIDISKDYIPVAPAAHYFMGGVLVNVDCETSIKNLYAIGEVSSTGLHGANRLASNSLLECVVCAHKVAEVVAAKSKHNIMSISANSKKIALNGENIPKLNMYKQQLKDTMWENVGIFRCEETLQKALETIENIEKEFPVDAQVYSLKAEYEFRNMLIVAKLIVMCAINRKESRGAHYRTDFPQTNSFAKHSYVN